jgi:thymidylate synthase
MNSIDKQYQALLQDILDNGVTKKDRTGTGTISIFGRQIRHKMSDGFPLLTTKKMYFKGIVTELLWFLRGNTNIKFLVDNNCHIWNEDAYKGYEKECVVHGVDPMPKEQFIQGIKNSDGDPHFIPDLTGYKLGDLGPIYGKQWRSWKQSEAKLTTENGIDWKHHSEKTIDQIVNSINLLKTDPDSRRNKVSAWNVGELEKMVLPPCHTDFQFYTRELSLEERMKYYYKNRLKNPQQEVLARNHTDEQKLQYLAVAGALYPIPTRAISLMWNQRSSDTFLGLPFNIASYGLLLEIVAKVVNMVPDELIGNLGDTHLYLNHIEQAKEQIGREISLEERRSLVSQEMFNQIYTGGGPDSLNHSECDQWNIPRFEDRKPYPLPKLVINSGNENWHLLDIDEIINSLDPDITFNLENYKSYPAIKAPLSN